MKCPKCAFITDMELDYNTHLLFYHGIVRSVCKTQVELLKQILYERLIREHHYFRMKRDFAHLRALTEYMNELGFKNIPSVYKPVYDNREKQITKLNEQIEKEIFEDAKTKYKKKLLIECEKAKYNRKHAKREKISLEEMPKELDDAICLTRFRNEYTVEQIIQEKIEGPYDLLNIEVEKIDDMMKDIENKVSSSIR